MPVCLVRLANVKEDNSVFQSEAEAISKAPVTSERRRIEQPIEMPNKDELDFSQPKKEEKISFFFWIDDSNKVRVLQSSVASSQTALWSSDQAICHQLNQNQDKVNSHFRWISS